jgi:hypothetical protein
LAKTPCLLISPRFLFYFKNKRFFQKNVPLHRFGQIQFWFVVGRAVGFMLKMLKVWKGF